MIELKIKGINHITLSVSNLEKSFAFYKDIMSFKPKVKWDEGAYFLAGDLWLCLSLDENVRKESLKEYSHIAFDLESEDFNNVLIKIREFGIKEFKENSSEGESIYFLDPDGHKLEIHCGTLESRLNEYRKMNNHKFEFYE